MPKGFKKKNMWEDLPQEFKDQIDNSDEAACRKTLSEVGIAQELLLQAKKADQQLAEAQEAFKSAGAGYRDGTKANRLKTRYVVERMKAMGKVA